MSDSYKPLFDTGDLVVTPEGNIGIVDMCQYVAGPSSNPGMVYKIKCGSSTGPFGEYVFGEVLRAPTFREFIWFRNPNTGGWMFGKTRGWMAGIIHLFSLIIFSCGFTIEEFGWQLFTHAFGLSIIGLLWFGTWMNHTKRWV